MKKALFLPFLRSLSITYFDNLESGKKTAVLEKSLDPNPVWTLILKCDVFAAIAVVDAKAPSYGWTGVFSLNQIIKILYSNVAANKLYNGISPTRNTHP